MSATTNSIMIIHKDQWHSGRGSRGKGGRVGGRLSCYCISQHTTVEIQYICMIVLLQSNTFLWIMCCYNQIYLHDYVFPISSLFPMSLQHLALAVGNLHCKWQTLHRPSLPDPHQLLLLTSTDKRTEGGSLIPRPSQKKKKKKKEGKKLKRRGTRAEGYIAEC